MTRIFRARACRETASGGDGRFADLPVDSALASGAGEDDSPAGYALKVLRKSRQNEPGAVSVICREVQAARAVCHPHVIAVLAAGLHGPPYYVVTPWLPGRTLAGRLAPGAGLDLPVVLWIIRQVAEAMEGMLAPAGCTATSNRPTC